MLRDAFADRLKQAMKARDAGTVSAVRLIRAALKERDVAARGEGRPEGLADAEIGRMLQGMIRQRRESIALYEEGKRPDLADKEKAEIAVIESFLPQQMGEAETEAAVKAVVAELGASGVRDMGRVMAGLRERHPGSLDLARASAVARRLLG
jgi:uncharacterized protein